MSASDEKVAAVRERFDSPEARRVVQELQLFQKQIRELMPLFAAAAKKAVGKSASADEKRAFADVSEKIEKLRAQEDCTWRSLAPLLGLSLEELEELFGSEGGGDRPSRLLRQSLVAECTPSTDNIETSLARGFGRLMSFVDQDWLRGEAAKGFRIGEEFTREPLSIVSGTRLASERRSIHKYAQALLVTRDFLQNHPNYDFFAGASLVAQIARLCDVRPELKRVRGDWLGRLRGLQTHVSERVESDMYELMVAGSMRMCGLDVELLEPGPEKIPDIRIHGFDFPVVAECKRRQYPTQYEEGEEKCVRSLFEMTAGLLRGRDLAGTLDLELSVEASELELASVSSDCLCVAGANSGGGHSVKPWGAVTWRPIAKEVQLPRCRLYGYRFMRDVFAWDVDLPRWDGVVCSVTDPGGLMVVRAAQPVSIRWVSRSDEALTKKARSIASLYKEVTDQIPDAEMGFGYICLREGGPPDVVDERLKRVSRDLQGWMTSRPISAPALITSRLFPRFLDGERPDMIENAVQWCSQTYGDPIWFEILPGCVFSSPRTRRSHRHD